MSGAQYIVPRHNLSRETEGSDKTKTTATPSEQEDEKEGVAFAEQPSSGRGRMRRWEEGRGRKGRTKPSIIIARALLVAANKTFTNFRICSP